MGFGDGGRRCLIIPDSIFTELAKNGPWALLFGLLLYFVLRENSKREAKYQEIIEKQADKLEIVKEIKEDTCEIKTKIAQLV